MPELAILLDRVLTISKFYANLSKCLLKNCASSPTILIVLLLLFKIIDSFRKAFSKKTPPSFFQDFRRQFYGLVFQKQDFQLCGASSNTEIFGKLKRVLDSPILVFKNLFLSFDWFIIAFLSDLLIKLQLFDCIYFICFCTVLVKNR